MSLGSLFPMLKEAEAQLGKFGDDKKLKEEEYNNNNTILRHCVLFLLGMKFLRLNFNIQFDDIFHLIEHQRYFLCH